MLSFRALISFSSASSSSAPFSGFSSVVSSVLVSGSHAFASSPSSGFGSAGFSPSGVWSSAGASFPSYSSSLSSSESAWLR